MLVCYKYYEMKCKVYFICCVVCVIVVKKLSKQCLTMLNWNIFKLFVQLRSYQKYSVILKETPFLLWFVTDVCIM